MKPPLSTIAILGPGLLGGSVALAAQASPAIENVHLWARREAAIRQIKSLRIADLASTNLAEVVHSAQLIVLATPVGIMPRLVSQLLQLPLTPGAIITDLGSVKLSLVNSIDSLLTAQTNIRFVGSHPMAGKELTGIEHACANLFQESTCVITPGSSSDPNSIQIVESFWQALGCRTTKMHPQQHDLAVARVSHLPHLAASLIASSALEQNPDLAAISGSGLRDTTRVASGSPEMWTEILLENKTAIVPALRDLSSKLTQALAFLESGDSQQLHSLLQHAKELRDSLNLSNACGLDTPPDTL